MLRLYAFFHLNLMFSSIEEEQRPNVIQRCYWPILDLAERLGIPIGIEATGFTFETIEKLDPAWIAKCQSLVASGLIEIIGSGYTQLIGPLMPAELVRRNLMLGQIVYQRLFDCAPALALINEQAYSSGILSHYQNAGYRAVLMDWDMCAHAHPEWQTEWRYHPQLAVSPSARLPVLWTSTVIFQKLQRLAHGEMELDDYLALIRRHAGGDMRTLAIYNNDAECFDFRPGRFATEATTDGASEWKRIEAAFKSLAREPDTLWVRPSGALESSRNTYTLQPIELESAAFPIPVKKQLKYNVSRWAVTGRASFAINSRCRAVATALQAENVEDIEAWRALSLLSASDFRTHITHKRFESALEKLCELESRMPVAANSAPSARTSIPNAAKIQVCARHIDLTGPGMRVRLNPRRGLSIDSIEIPGRNGFRRFAGTVPHGTYDDLVHAFDWYSGTLICEFVAQPKVTDLAAVAPDIAQTTDKISLQAEIGTPLGPIIKRLEFDGQSLTTYYTLDWPVQERGVLRVANLTLLPDTIDAESLYFETHNGGFTPERFPLAGRTVDHGAPVSFLVSASSGVGMTQGELAIGDSQGGLILSAEPASMAYLGLVTHRLVKDKVFCRVALSAAELDDTRKPWPATARPLTLGYRICAFDPARNSPLN